MNLSGHDLCEHNVSEAYCYTCLHKHITQLEAVLVNIEEYGTEEINAAVKLRQELAKAKAENERLRERVKALEQNTSKSVLRRINVLLESREIPTGSPMGREFPNEEQE